MYGRLSWLQVGFRAIYLLSATKCSHGSLVVWHYTAYYIINKSAQSNFGRGPRRGAVAHVCRKVPISYNGAAQIRPQNTPYRGPIPKPHYLPHQWTRPAYDAKRHPDPICHFPTMHWTDRRTHARTYRYVRTDRSYTGKFDDYRPLRYESDAA